MARIGFRSGNGSLKTRVSRSGLVREMLCACALLALPALAQAGQVSISWDRGAGEDVAGYRLYNAPVGQPFGAPVDVGYTASHTLTGLDAGTAYRAAISAYDSLGQESPLSDEVVYNPKRDEDADTDGDGLPDGMERAGCTNPNDADTDDDGLADGAEDADRDGVRGAAETDACAADSDGDGLQDGTELGVTLALAGPGTDPSVFRPDLDPASATDPLTADTDVDGLADGAEDRDANGRVDAGETDPRLPDNPLLFADAFSDGGKGGDPSWKRVLGSWSVVGRAKQFASANVPASMALIADRHLRDFRSGRIESSVTLTRAFAAAPDARIVFHVQDASHYRFVRLTGTGISIGQVGSSPVEKAGVKAARPRKLKLDRAQRVRVDIEDGTKVKVYLNGDARPVLTHRFVVSSAGRVGYRTEGARSLFDDAAVWSDFVLR